jgi:hypothetical protein
MQECAMLADLNMQADNTKQPKRSEPKVPAPIWFGGMVVRSLFLIVMTVLTARVASPQIETIRSVFETPGDLIRVALGFAVCAWFVINLFILPKDPGAYRTWLYMGLALLPLSLLCTFVVW